jgi:6-phosphogluconate dehydrogenase (decarboxylating)
MAMLRPEQSRRCGDILADAVNSGKYLGGQVTESVACARGLEGMVTCRALKLLTDLRERGVQMWVKLSARKSIEAGGAGSAPSLEVLVAGLEAPRTVWLMVPAGDVTVVGTGASLEPLIDINRTIMQGLRSAA